MSIIDTYYGDAKIKVAEIQRVLNDNIEALRNSDVYTPQGRRVEMARATRAALQEANELKSRFVEMRTARKDELERHLFGVSGSATATQVVNIRDAQDRVDRLGIQDADKAHALMRRAIQSGDDGLARAIAQRAINSESWGEIVDTYTASVNDRTRDMLTELRAIPSGARTNTTDNVVFRVRPPHELSGLAESDINTLAGTGTDTARTEHHRKTSYT